MSADLVPLAGVIGSPVAHSLSPKVHGYWLAEHGLAGHYIPMDVASDNLKAAFATLPRLGFKGVNVTLPHKERALSLADRVSDRAAVIGAANTITFQPDGSIHADNTDGVGFIENLRAGAPHWSAATGPAVVLGAGGAARGVLASLLDAGAPEIRLANRTRVRGEALRADFGPKVTVIDWHRIPDALDGAALLVNTTSLGMSGHSPLSIALDGLPKDAIVTDIVYNPLETHLLQMARDGGHVTVDGLGMLLHQAVPGFARWFGTRPKVTDALRAAVLAE
ncbi:shikimate dehydrogenase [Tropicimonas sp. S265A]|uniref:shikimate dehydrogenase n=1 Tax=Tropicimonas sp. S265A TaxID=3415134 RepID=UPI003C7AFFD9